MSETLQKNQNPRLSIVIVSYNTVDLLRDCLQSVLSQLGRHDEVIVVDNASSDGSADMVANHFQNISLIASDKNLGFGKANNKGIALAKSELIWLLNPDTRLMPTALDKAVGFMASNSSIGMAGTALIYPDGSPQSSVERRYPGHRHARAKLGHLPGEIAWVMGASIVARRDALESVGGFDEQFFLYGEEIDLCLMVRKRGWPIGFIKDAAVQLHLLLLHKRQWDAQHVVTVLAIDFLRLAHVIMLRGIALAALDGLVAEEYLAHMRQHGDAGHFLLQQGNLENGQRVERLTHQLEILGLRLLPNVKIAVSQYLLANGL